MDQAAPTLSLCVARLQHRSLTLCATATQTKKTQNPHHSEQLSPWPLNQQLAPDRPNRATLLAPGKGMAPAPKRCCQRRGRARERYNAASISAFNATPISMVTHCAHVHACQAARATHALIALQLYRTLAVTRSARPSRFHLQSLRATIVCNSRPHRLCTHDRPRI